MPLLPGKDLLADIKRAEKESQMINPKAVAVAIGAFEAGEFNADSVDAWCEQQREKRPELFKATDTKDDGVVDELHAAAFGPNPSLKAQGELVQKVGEAKAKEIASGYGAELGKLKAGTAKSAVESSNPWKLPTGTPEERAKSQEAIAGFVARNPTKMSAGYALSAGKTISGTLLKK